jgi:hypothetical protein
MKPEFREYLVDIKAVWNPTSLKLLAGSIATRLTPHSFDWLYKQFNEAI